MKPSFETLEKRELLSATVGAPLPALPHAQEVQIALHAAVKQVESTRIIPGLFDQPIQQAYMDGAVESFVQRYKVAHPTEEPIRKDHLFVPIAPKKQTKLRSGASKPSIPTALDPVANPIEIDWSSIGVEETL